MFLKLSSVFFLAVVGLWGRGVCGVATKRRAPALGARSVSGGKGRGQKVRQTLGLAVRERTKTGGVYCAEGNCPEWPEEGDHYRVPYAFAGDAYTPQQLADFKWVVDFFGRFSNLKFVERGPDETGKYAKLSNDKGDTGVCFGRPQDWPFTDVLGYISARCMTTGTISKVLMQVAGFHYEHTRPDRDNYVTVQNICEGSIQSAKEERVDNSTPYDLASVLQLPPSDPWFSCPSDTVSFVAKDSSLQVVVAADKMAPSTCDLLALSKRFPGPVKAPECVPHEMSAVCAPVDDCEAILGIDEAACREECKMKCQRNIAPLSMKPACRLLSVEEISFETTTGSKGSATSPLSASSAHSHMSSSILLLGGAVAGAAVPLFMH